MLKYSSENICLHITISLLIGIFSLFMLSEIGFIFGLSINVFYLLIAIEAMILLPKYLHAFTPKESICSLCITIILLAFSAFISLQYNDISWDGHWYHQTGALFLKKGWNPIYQTAQEFFATHWQARNVSGIVYIDSYPKFCEIFAANIYYLTENIEAGKIINILSLITLGIYSFYVLTQNIFKQKRFLALITSIAFCANPIVISQLYTYYVDTNIYVYFMLMLFSLLEIEQSNIHKQNTAAWFILISSAIILANIKLGGLLYVIEILLLYGLYLFIYKKTKIWHKLKKALIVILLGICITGINPYITNLKQGHHLFYPLAGAQKEDIMTRSLPMQFINRSMPYKFFMSTFSQVDNKLIQITKAKIHLKTPFTITPSELNKHVYVFDTRQSGFGVFWSGILLVSIILAFFIRSPKNIKIRLCTSAALLCIITVLLNPENWWARYVPQFHAFAIFIAMSFLCSKQTYFRSKIYNLFIILILFNFSITGYFIINRTRTESMYQKQFLQYIENGKCNPYMVESIEKNKIPPEITAPILIFLDELKRK